MAEFGAYLRHAGPPAADRRTRTQGSRTGHLTKKAREAPSGDATAIFREGPLTHNPDHESRCTGFLGEVERVSIRADHRPCSASAL
jgi:hypothetical protein